MLTNGATMPLNKTSGAAVEEAYVASEHAASTTESDQAAMVVPPTALTMKPNGPGTPDFLSAYTK